MGNKLGRKPVTNMGVLRTQPRKWDENRVIGMSKTFIGNVMYHSFAYRNSISTTWAEVVTTPLIAQTRQHTRPATSVPHLRGPLKTIQITYIV